jgi:hypothetical protein
MELVLDESKINGWLQWLNLYYPRGNTVRNKCQHLAGFLSHVKTVKGYGDNDEARMKISICRTVLKAGAQSGKIKGIKQKAIVDNEEQLLSKGSY